MILISLFGLNNVPLVYHLFQNEIPLILSKNGIISAYKEMIENMKSAMIKTRIQSDILEWSLPKEVLSVLLKDRTTGDFVFPKSSHTV